MNLAAVRLIRQGRMVEHQQSIIPHMRQAKTASERIKGLLGSNALLAGEGLWIVPCNSIHTLFMKYELDIVYLDRHNRICRLIAKVKPWRGNFCLAAASVIELAAGQIKELGLLVGDEIQWEVNSSE